MVVVFFGTPQFAVPSLESLLASNHSVVGVVTQPDKPRGRGQKVVEGPVKATAVAHNVPVIQPERLREPDAMETLRGWQPDLGVVAAYGKILSEELLALPRLGMINVHASLLPKYRGASPIHRAVMDGETETGVTIMRMVKALDAGAMIAKVRRPIDPDETSDAVERDLATLGAGLLIDVVEQMAKGPVAEEPQDDAQSTYAPRLTKDEGVIDWSLPAAVIHNRVRGLYPWPHAYTYLDGSRLIVMKTGRLKAAPTSDIESSWGPPSGGPIPGTIIAASSDGIQVATGGGESIAITELQPEGKRAMRVRDYLAGRPVRAGACFGSP